MKQLLLCRLSKNFLLPVIAFISVASFAQPALQKSSTETKTVELFDPYDEILVLGDTKIVLTNNLEGRLVFQGDHKSVEAAKARIKNGRLIIDVQRKTPLSKFTLYLPASSMRSLVTSGKTEIYSSGTIKSNDLEILLNGSSTVSINHEGKLRVTPGAGYEISNRKE